MAAEIPALKVSRDSSRSWFHSLILDGKKDSLYVLVLQYAVLSFYMSIYCYFFNQGLNQ